MISKGLVVFFYWIEGTKSVKINNMLEIDFIALRKFRRIQLKLATNRIKKGILEPEIQPFKGAQCQYGRPMTSRDVIGLTPVTISLLACYF